MFGDLVPVAVVGIVFLSIYKMISLFARRNERLTFIEKMGENLNPEILEKQMRGLNFPNSGQTFTSLKWGCLLIGLGCGLLTAFFICQANGLNYNDWGNRELMSTIYGGSILLFGGISLVVAFVIEQKIRNRKE